MDVKFCKTCGAPLEQIDAYTWRCGYCHNEYSDKAVQEESERLLNALMSQKKLEEVANLRKNLYDAINARYTDSDEICRICMNIRALIPDDFMACFYYTANHGTPKEICEAIRGVDARENISLVEGIVKHMVKSMRTEYALPLQNLIERAYKQSDTLKFEKLSTAVSDEAEKVNAGMYETSVPRDVFVAYSSKDMPTVEALVEYLEENCLDCFVAARNLRHGRGSVQNYEMALHEAMDNCKCVVFVSSENSRTMDCDALRVELKYIKNQDILNSPPEFRRNYISIPGKYKKNRIEYRIDNSASSPRADKILKEFFSGLEYVYSPEGVMDAIDAFDYEIPTEEEPSVREPENAVKYCAVCGAEVPLQSKFCLECGKNEFVDTYKEFELTKKLSDMLKEDAERKAREAKQAEEAKKAAAAKAAEDARKAAAAKAAEDARKAAAAKAAEDARKAAAAKAAEDARKAAAAKAAEDARKAAAAKAAEDAGRAYSPSLSASDLKLFKFTSLSDGTYSVQLKDRDGNYPKNIVIPSTYLGKKVTKIDSCGFLGCRSLESLTIPDTVTEIGGVAFAHCPALRNFFIPASVRKMDNNPFVEIPINEITIAATNREYKIESGCVIETSTGRLVTGSDECMIPGYIKRIGTQAFRCCSKLQKIIIPDSVKWIDSFAFSGCYSLDEVSLPAGLNSIDSSAFESGHPKKVTFGGSREEWDKISRGRFADVSVTCLGKSGYTSYSPVSSSGASASNTSLFEFSSLSDGTYGVQLKDRSGNYPKRIVIPSTYNGKKVTKIDSCGFLGCRALESLTIPDSITTIDNVALAHCPSLKNLYIPASVTKMGDSPFIEIPINEITIAATNRGYKIEGGCVIEISTGRLVTGSADCRIPNSVKEIGFQAFRCCYGLKQITVPSSVRKISNNAFSGCTALEEITLPSGLSPLEGGTFSECKLKKVTFGGSREEWNRISNGLLGGVSVTCLGESGYTSYSPVSSSGASASDTSLFEFSSLPDGTYSVKLKDKSGNYPKRIVIPSTYLGKKVTKIDSCGFLGCRSLESLTIPDSITMIDSIALAHCPSLKKLYIPASVTKMGNSPFVEIPINEITIDRRNKEYKIEGGCVIEISTGRLVTGSANCRIPNSVREIGFQAFRCCYGLKQITVPSSVRKISNNAFSGCSALEDVTLPSGLSKLESDTFSGCNLKKITFCGSRSEWKKICGKAVPFGVKVVYSDSAI